MPECREEVLKLGLAHIAGMLTGPIFGPPSKQHEVWLYVPELALSWAQGCAAENGERAIIGLLFRVAPKSKQFPGWRSFNPTLQTE
jgi:hypothetical protein